MADKQMIKRAHTGLGFVGWGLAMLIIALIGFWPSFFQPTLAATFNSPAGMMYWHVGFTFLWLIMLFVQPLLIYLKGLKWHRYFGAFSLLVAIGVIFSGFTVQLQFMHHYAVLGEQTHAVMVPFFRLVTLLVFTVCILMGMIIKDRSWHKRLMFLGSFSILEAAFARVFLNYFDLLELSGLLAVLVHVLIMAGFIVWDRKRIGYFHPVSLWASIIITVVIFATAPIANTQWWQAVAAQLANWVNIN